MVNQNKESLRQQIIDAMNAHTKLMGWGDRTPTFNINMFDEAIMPVLDAAMTAGELLLHRVTTPQKPVNESIVDWLEACCAMVGSVHRLEHTASKRELLRLLYSLEENAIIAVADARALKPETTSGAMWGSLAGKSPPLKG